MLAKRACLAALQGFAVPDALVTDLQNGAGLRGKHEKCRARLAWVSSPAVR
jgi:hypothetical protein